MRLLLRPEHRGQETRHFAATAAALKYFGSGSAPIPTATSPSSIPRIRAAATAWSTRCCSPAAPTGWRRRGDGARVDVIIHETGHQWFYGVVATNEFEHGWMDEGITTWATARVIEEARLPNTLAVRTFGTFLPSPPTCRCRAT